MCGEWWVVNVCVVRGRCPAEVWCGKEVVARVGMDVWCPKAWWPWVMICGARVVHRLTCVGAVVW